MSVDIALDIARWSAASARGSVPSWTVTMSGPAKSVGVERIGAFKDGHKRGHVVWMNGSVYKGGSDEKTISQVLKARAKRCDEGLYVLTADFGWRTDNPRPSGPQVLRLYAGGALLAPIQSTAPALVKGEWVTHTNVYRPHVSGELMVQVGLGSNTAGHQLNIDRITLTKKCAPSAPAVAVTVAAAPMSATPTVSPCAPDVSKLAATSPNPSYPSYPTMSLNLYADEVRNAQLGSPAYYPEIDDACAAIFKATKGVGTDERAIIAILGSKNDVERSLISHRYKEMYQKELNELMRKENSGDFGFLTQLLSLPVPEAEAKIVRKATKGISANKKLLYSVICGRSNEEIDLLKKVYFKRYKKDLTNLVSSEVSGDLKKVCLANLQGMEEKYDPAYHTASRAEEDAQTFYKAGQGKKFGTDEEALFDIICRSPPRHLRTINDAYSKRHDVTLARALEKELRGKAEDAAVFTVGMKLDPHVTIAKYIKSACAGMGTNELALSCAILRYQRVLPNVMIEHTKLYSKTIGERIASETSGDFQRLLMAMVECASAPSSNDQTAVVAAAAAAVSGLTIESTPSPQNPPAAATVYNPPAAAALPVQATVYNPHVEPTAEVSVQATVYNPPAAATLPVQATLYNPPAAATLPVQATICNPHVELKAEVAVPKLVTLRSRNYPEHVWTCKARGQQLEIAIGDGSSLTMMPGLATMNDKSRAHDWIGDSEFERARLGGDLVSFRTADGRYLRHRGFQMHADPLERSPLFSLDATFVWERSRFFPGCDAFRSVNYADRHIGHRSFRLRIEQADDSDLHRNDASFVLRNVG